MRAHFVLALRLLALASFAIVKSVQAETSKGATWLLEAGIAAYREGHVEEAVELWTLARHRYAAESSGRGQIEALVRRAEAYQTLGFSHKALEDLRSCRDIARPDEDADLLEIATLLTGRARASLGELEMTELPKGGDNAAVARISRAAVAGYLDRANFLVARGLWPDALEAYRRGLAHARSLGDNELAATAAVNGARAALIRPAEENPEAWLTQARSFIAAIPPGRNRMRLVLGYVDVSLSDRNLFRASVAELYGDLEDVRSWAASAGDQRLLSVAAGYLSRLYQHQRRWEDALILASEALQIAERVGDPTLIYEANRQEGRLLAILGNIDGAIAVYRRALEEFRLFKSDVLRTSLQAGGDFRSVVGSVYLELADLLLRRSSADDAVGQLDLAAARNIVEESRVAELEDYFGDQCVAALKALEAPVFSLARNVAALYPILFDDRTELLLAIDGRIRRYTVPVSVKRISEEANSLRYRLERVTTRQFLPRAQQLYEWLLRPLEGDLEQSRVDTLVFIPDGALRAIPLAALHDGHRFVAERYATVVSPGLTLMDVRPFAQTGEVNALVGALTEAADGFPPLPAVAQEVATIEAIFPAKVLRNIQFSISAFQAELAAVPYSVIHIASHGVVAADPRESFVLASDGKLTLDSLEAMIKQSEFRTKPVELLTLSACSTAAGDDRAALGLAGIGIKAGARSAIASLWFVNDQAATEMVSQFYGSLKDPLLTKARALQQAQQSMLRDPRFVHPGHWSPFLLIGNWL